jgi:dolichol-phosphate mannosyltransferase
MNRIGKISFVIPVYNEEENIGILFSEINDVMTKLSLSYEIIFVNDCSTDSSPEILKDLVKHNHKVVRTISFSRNKGQSAALAAGFRYVTGDVTITMDADLQNDPRDIPAMLKLYSKYDMVTGWRFNRQDNFGKRISSKIGNAVRNLLTSEHIHDTGCSLKIMRTSILREIKLYKGLHRFLPTLFRVEGGSVIEVKVHHRPRIHGLSKYTNLRRGIEGLRDLLVVRWMMSHSITLKVGELSYEK